MHAAGAGTARDGIVSSVIAAVHAGQAYRLACGLSHLSMALLSAGFHNHTRSAQSWPERLRDFDTTMLTVLSSPSPLCAKHSREGALLVLLNC
jgi:hypothetical protein